MFFFDTGSDAPDAQQLPGLLDWTVSWLKDAHATRILLIGSTDRVGPSAANLRLARRRALAVKRILVKRGIPAAAILIDARGEAGGIIETPDEAAERQNRFVMVEILKMKDPNAPSTSRDPVPTLIPHSRNSPTLPSVR